MADLVEAMGRAFVATETAEATDLNGDPITWDTIGPMRRDRLRECMVAVLRVIDPDLAPIPLPDEGPEIERLKTRIREILAA